MIILKITFASLFLSILISFILPKIYTATTRIIPPQQDQGMMGLMIGQMGGGMAGLASDFLGSGSSTDLYVGILKSEAIKDAIIDSYNLIAVYDNDYRIDTYKDLEKKVDIVAGKKDGIISITVEDKDPRRAADIANSFVVELGKLTTTLNITGARQSKSFLAQRLEKSKIDLASAENALKAFQSKNKAIDVTEQAKASISGIAELQTKLAVTEVQMEMVRRQFTDSSQEVKNLITTINQLKSQINRLEGNGNISAIPSVGALPSLGQEYIRLMREYKVQEGLVELLTKQYEMTKLSEAKDVSTIQIIQKARIPDKKDRPKRSIIVLLSTVMGFCISIITVFIMENYNQSSTEEKLRWNSMIRQLFFLNHH